MNGELAIVLLLLAAAIAMFVINRPRMDAVALIMITMMPLTSNSARHLCPCKPGNSAG
jgi:hypothetical protein